MRYISLMGAMKYYGACVENRRALHGFSFDMVSRNFDSGTDYHVFTIETGEPDENGQIEKTLRFSQATRANLINIMGCMQPSFVRMLPILELEWIAQQVEISENYKEILEYLAYMFIMQTVCWNDGRVNMQDSDCYMRVLENSGVFMELDDLSTALSRLSAIELPPMKLPKIRSWQALYCYHESFSLMLHRCNNQSQRLKTLYLHAPILFVMFMIPCKARKVKDWPASCRIELETELANTVSTFGMSTVCGPVPVTYGSCPGVTGQDMAFLRFIFDMILKELRLVNNDMGLITVTDYRNVRGPETARANIRLTRMGIDWTKELAKAEEEKKRREEEADELFDEEKE